MTLANMHLSVLQTPAKNNSMDNFPELSLCHTRSHRAQSSRDLHSPALRIPHFTVLHMAFPKRETKRSRVDLHHFVCDFIDMILIIILGVFTFL